MYFFFHLILKFIYSLRCTQKKRSSMIFFVSRTSCLKYQVPFSIYAPNQCRTSLSGHVQSNDNICTRPSPWLYFYTMKHLAGSLNHEYRVHHSGKVSKSFHCILNWYCSYRSIQACMLGRLWSRFLHYNSQ